MGQRLEGLPVSTRALLAHICDVVDSCTPLRAMFDVDSGVRRMEWGLEKPWQNVLTYGRATRRRRDPGERRPIYAVTVEFAPWIRGEAAASTMGDLILADIEEYLMRIFDLERHGPDTCDEFILLESMFDDFSTPPDFDDTKQAWTQVHRFRFDIVVSNCKPPAENCFTCP